MSWAPWAPWAPWNYPADAWYGAHADLNTPGDTATGHLGRLVYSGPLGLWDSGLGAGLSTHKAV